MEHLVVGLECFDLDLLDYNPIDVEHKKHGRGVTFSQVSGGGKNNQAHYHVIVSERGLVLPSGMSLPYSNEQQPTMVMLLLLSAMVDERPLEFEPCSNCKEDA